MNDLFVGQEVTIHDHHEGPRKLGRVAVAGKRKITLDDGSEWDRRTGHVAGKGSEPWYTGWRIVARHPTDAEHIERRVLVQRLSAVKWQRLTTDALRACALAVKNGEPT